MQLWGLLSLCPTSICPFYVVGAQTFAANTTICMRLASSCKSRPTSCYCFVLNLYCAQFVLCSIGTVHNVYCAMFILYCAEFVLCSICTVLNVYCVQFVLCSICTGLNLYCVQFVLC